MVPLARRLKGGLLRQIASLALALLLFAPAQAATFVDVNNQALDFSVGAGDVRISGSANTAGETWLYKNVITVGSQVVDAIVSFDSISGGSSMTNFDSTSNPYSSAALGGTPPNFLQPNFTWNSSGGSASFTVKFIEGDSYVAVTQPNGIPVTLRNVTINSYDLDSTSASASGDGGNQFTSFSEVGGLELSSATALVASLTGTLTTIEPDPTVPSPGNITFAPGTADGDEYRVRVTYDAVSVFNFVVGARNGAGIAYYAVDFSMGPAFVGVTSYDLVVTDGVIVTTEAGTTDTFSLQLSAAPTHDVTITLTGLDATEHSLSTTTLTFTPLNWNTAQTVTVTGLADALADGSVNYLLNATAASTDPLFNGLKAVVDMTNQSVVAVVNDPVVNEGSDHVVFTINGTIGDSVQLALADGTATSLDYGAGLEYWDGAAWQGYAALSFVPLDAAGTLLVRTPIKPDALSDNGETFTLAVSNVGGLLGSGTCTIKDDGTGSYWIADATAPATAGELTTAGVTLDDDRPVTINFVTVNEGSQYGIFKACGIEGQLIELELRESGLDYLDGDAELGVDLNPAFEYWDGSAWQSYTPGDFVPIPQVGGALDGEAACMLVRVEIYNDTPAVFEGVETFVMAASNAGGTEASCDCSTIADDGTGDVYLVTNTDGDPNDPTDPGYPLALDNDSLHILKWGVAGADPVAGFMDATIIENTSAAPLVYAGMNDGRFDLHMTTSGFAYNGLMMIGGEASWAINPRATASTVQFRFYDPGTTTPHPIRNIYFSIEDAEVDEEFSNFIYWDASGNQVSLPWSDVAFSYSHTPELTNGDLTVHNGAVLVGKPQAGKWIRVDLRGTLVTGFQFSYRQASPQAGTVQITHLCGEPGKFDFDVENPDTFGPLVIKADVNNQAAMPDYRAQMTYDPTLVGAVVSQTPAPGTLMALGDHSVTMTLTTADSQTATTGFVLNVRPAKKPVLAVLTPAVRSTTLATLSPYRVSGYVRDLEAVGMDRIELVLNGGAPQAATLSGAPSDIYREWHLDIAPQEGPNTLDVTAIDNESISSAVVSRSFDFTRRYALDITTNGTAGVVGLRVAAGGAYSLVASNPPTNDYTVAPGSVITLTATAKSNSVFSHWSGLPGGAAVTGNQAVILMPNADVSGVVAHFVANPFTPPAGQSRVFAGLLAPVNAADQRMQTVGHITGSLSTSGLFSGKLMNLGLTDRFVVNFFGNGSSLFNLGGGVTTASLSLSGGRTVTMLFDTVNGTITASLTRLGVVSTATLQRSIYGSGANVAANLLNRKLRASDPANTVGFYTMALPSEVQVPALALSSYPQGAGYGTIYLQRSGILNASGVLADGTSFTWSSVLVAGDQAPVFAQLKTPGATTLLGSLGGHLDFAVAAASDVTSSDLIWIRPAVVQQSGTTALAKQTQIYTSGWSTGITVGCSGALYDSTSSVQTSLALPAPDAVNGNAELQFNEGKLIAPVTISTLNVTGNAASKIPTTDRTYSLTFSASVGLYSGTFTPNWTTPSSIKPGFKGILVRKGFTGPAGYGYFHSNRTLDLDPESGEVTLGAP
jgi:hypothetical protein